MLFLGTFQFAGLNGWLQQVLLRIHFTFETPDTLPFGPVSFQPCFRGSQKALVFVSDLHLLVPQTLLVVLEHEFVGVDDDGDFLLVRARERPTFP